MGVNVLRSSIRSIARAILPAWIFEKVDRPGFKRYFENTGWMYVGQMFSLLASFFIGAWIARYLGPQNYGTFNYALSFVGMFSFVASLGIGTILFRDLVRYPEKRDVLMGTSFRLLIYGGTAAFILVIISSFIFESSLLVRELVILYASTFLWGAFSILQVSFQALVNAKRNVYGSIIAGSISSLLKVFLILTHRGIIFLMVVFVFESLMNAAIGVFYYRRSGLKFNSWKFDRTIAKSLLSGGFLLMLGASASFLLLKIDQIMIGKLLGELSVGLYAAAVRLVEAWYFIPGLICSSLFPAIVNAKKVDNGIYHRRLNNLYILLGAVAILIAIPSTILAPWIIRLLFGGAYIESVGILRIYVWSGVGLFLLWGVYQYYLSENRLRMIFFMYFFPMVLNVILNLIFIPKFGLVGAAWATLISYSAAPLAMLLVERIKRINYTRKDTPTTQTSKL